MSNSPLIDLDAAALVLGKSKSTARRVAVQDRWQGRHVLRAQRLVLVYPMDAVVASADRLAAQEAPSNGYARLAGALLA